VGKRKHGDTSLDTAVSLKKGNFNTSSAFHILKKENGGFDCYFKTITVLLRHVTANKQVAISQQSFSVVLY